MTKSCPFCTLSEKRILDDTGVWLVIRDGYPVSPGHTLIIPKRHVSSFFELSAEEFSALHPVLERAKIGIDHEFSPKSYNIGVNDGPAAGQTVFHLHIHLIPRYEGDVPDPRGGVRWIFPDKADYWTSA